MYTEEMIRNKSNTYIEMRTTTTPDNKSKRMVKLGGAITASITKLNTLKVQIMKADVATLARTVPQFKREHELFMKLEAELMELEEETEMTIRLRDKVKEFLEEFKPEDIEVRMKNMQDGIRASKHGGDTYRPPGGEGSILIEQSLLEEDLLKKEVQQIAVLEKMMNEIKRMAVDTSKLIYEQGVILKIAGRNVQDAKRKMQEGRKNLAEANTYEKDTNKTKMFFCLLIVVIVAVIILLMFAART